MLMSAGQQSEPQFSEFPVLRRALIQRDLEINTRIIPLSHIRGSQILFLPFLSFSLLGTMRDSQGPERMVTHSFHFRHAVCLIYCAFDLD